MAAVIAFFSSSAIASYFVGRLSKRSDVRSDASKEEISVRAEFVRDLGARVRELEERLDEAYERERQLTDRWRKNYDALDRRYRHLTNNLVFYASTLRWRLQNAGVDPPNFTGWEQFAREGGDVQDRWLDTLGDPPTSNKGQDDDGKSG